jgi:uncharacterized protein
VAATQFHESAQALRVETRDLHRALASLIEEIGAVDWYGQRIDACGDAELASVLAHNRSEEIEHASMVLEWIRRRDPAFDHFLRRYLFTTGPIEEVEEEEDEANVDPVLTEVGHPRRSS